MKKSKKETNVIDAKYYTNNFLRWAITIPSVSCIVTIALIVTLETEFFHHQIRSDVFLIILLCVLMCLCANAGIKYAGYRLNKKYSRNFKEQNHIRSFKETLPQAKFTNKRAHAVLLLHGFTASTYEYRYLVKYLEDANIDYYATSLFGFGLSDANVLFQTSCEDWFRSALEAFDLLNEIAEEVSIVGHSMGGLLATYIATHRNVSQLILSCPGLYSTSSDLKYKKLLKTPIIGFMFKMCIPMLPKPIRAGRVSPSDTLDTAVIPDSFHYVAVPIKSVEQIFLAQERVDLTKVKAKNIHVLYGKYDLTVNNQEVIKRLEAANIPHERILYENSAHNILEDVERDKFCQDVVNILKKI